MEVDNEIAIQESGNYETFDRVNVAPWPHHYGHIRTNKDGDDDFRRNFVQLLVTEVSAPILHFDKSPPQHMHQQIADAKIKIYSKYI